MISATHLLSVESIEGLLRRRLRAALSEPASRLLLVLDDMDVVLSSGAPSLTLAMVAALDNIIADRVEQPSATISDAGTQSLTSDLFCDLHFVLFYIYLASMLQIDTLHSRQILCAQTFVNWLTL